MGSVDLRLAMYRKFLILVISLTSVLSLGLCVDKINPQYYETVKMLPARTKIELDNPVVISKNGDLDEMRMSGSSSAGTLKNPLVDVKDLDKVNPEKVMFKMPSDRGSRNLAKLVTTQGNGPVFALNEVLKPRVQTGDKNIATYKIIIPILIPALKPADSTKKSGRLRGLNIKEGGKMEEIVQTEMVPVEKKVKVMRTVEKAELIPQKTIIEYIKTQGGPVMPSDAEDLRPNEKVVKTVVKDF